LIRLTPSSFKSAHWSDRAANLVRAIRRAFTRENLIRNAKTLAGVIPLTILVWVVAEQQELVTSTAYVRISVQSADPAHRAVTLISPYDGTIQVTLQGSQAGIDHVKTLLHQTLVNDPMEIDVGTSLPPGPRQPLLTLDQIASNHIFFSQGVTVTACSPDALILNIEQLEDRTASVVAPPDVPGLVSAKFHPSTVIMRGPTSQLNSLARRGPLTVTADLTGLPALNSQGRHDGVAVGLVAPEDVSLIPSSVTADLTVGQADQSISVSPVPVMVLAPKFLSDNYIFDYKPILTQPVILTGPPLAIAQIDPRAARIVAVIKLDITDAGFHGSKPVSFEDEGLPEGVSIQPGNPAPTVQISVDPR